MNKKEAIEKIEGLKELSHGALGSDWIELGIDKALDVVKQLDETVKPPKPEPWAPEKPVVPQFVADWIEWCKRNSVTLLGGFRPIDELGLAICNDKKVKSLDASKWATHNSETFAKAWLFGYEIEKEKLYTVEIPNPNDFIDNHSRLARNYKGKVVLEVQDWLNTDESYELTEAEIKEDFEWAWQFAKEVEE